MSVARSRRFGAQPLIKDLNPDRYSILYNALSPFRIPFADTFRLAQELCVSLVEREQVSRFGLPAEHYASLAIAVPLKEGSRARLNYCTFAVPAHASTERAKEMCNQSRNRELERDFSTCAGVSLMGLLEPEGDFFRGLPPDIQQNFRDDVKASSNESVLALKKPATRYEGFYVPTVTKETGDDDPEFSFLRPVIVDESVIAIIVADAYGRRDSRPAKQLVLLFDTLARLLEGDYLAYYTRLDRAADKLAQRLRPNVWKWSLDGRVFSRQYLEDFIDRLTSQKPDTTPSADRLLDCNAFLVLYCDGNGIKRINDAFQHEIGNEAIRLIGGVIANATERLKRSFPELTDGIVARWGGDEFVALMGISSNEEDPVVQDTHALHMSHVFADTIRSELREAADQFTILLNQIADKKESPARPLPQTPHVSTRADKGRRAEDEEKDDSRKFGDALGIAIGASRMRRDDLSRGSPESWLGEAERAMYAAKSGAGFYRELLEKRRAVDDIDKGLTRASVVYASELKDFAPRMRRFLGHQEPPGALVPLVRLGYVMLRLDQLPHAGNWGWSINRYIELNHGGNAQVLAEKDRYVLEGSITHTAHALRGLSFVEKSISHLRADLIRSWIDRNSSNIGFVEPALPANPDEVNGLAKQIRHTTTACLALLRLRKHVDEAAAAAIDQWIEKHVPLLVTFPDLWIDDPELTYSHAYVLELLSLLRVEPKYSGIKDQIDRQIKRGLQNLFQFVSADALYWCAEKHPGTQVFYTLLILTRILSLPERLVEPAWLEQIVLTLRDINRTAQTIGGVPLGRANGDGRFFVADCGATAAFVECCYRAGTWLLPVRPLERQGITWLEALLRRPRWGLENAFTHTWESVLSLLTTARLRDSFDVEDFCGTVEPLLEEFGMLIDVPAETPTALIARLGELIGAEDVFSFLATRDVWDGIVATAALRGKTGLSGV